jgi:hypothetical protein
MQKILVGCDPEVFVKQNGIFKSAFGLIEGDKEHPQKVNRGAVQVDGMALEFNIDPADNEEEFCINVQDVLNTMKLMVPDYEVVAVPVADFPFEYLATQPAKALELGCEPDFNAWQSRENKRPDGNRPMRTASGHVHIGWTDGQNPTDKGHRERCDAVVKQLDFYLGLPSLVYDNDTRRRSMYGKAGACRYKSYGVEYRTLSNVWLNSPELIKWVFRATKRGVLEIMKGNALYEKYGDVQEIINTSDVKAALGIIKAEQLEVCHG